MTDLEAILSRIEKIDPVKATPAGLDYGMFDGDITTRLRDLFTRLWKAVSSYADVETPAGRTVVSWTGDVSTTVKNARSIEAHKQALDAALGRRTALLRILIAGLAVATVPANPFALLKLAKELEAAVNLAA